MGGWRGERWEGWDREEVEEERSGNSKFATTPLAPS